MQKSWVAIEGGSVVEAHEAHRLVPWWSFTKTVLAAAALVLVDRGALRLDEPSGDAPYTLRQLLRHQAGLVDYGGLPAYHEAVAAAEDPWPVSVLLGRLDAGRLRYPPGEGWSYSNIGYLTIGRLIEAASEEGLGSALKRLVLEPLGIEGAFLAQTRADLAAVAMGEARNYHPGWVYHGLLVGSVEEAALLLDRLMAGRLLPPGLLAEMLTPYELPGPVPGRPWAAPGYGLGVMSGRSATGVQVAGHTGGGPGSTIAVYHGLKSSPARTAAFFVTGDDQALAEGKTFALLAA